MSQITNLDPTVEFDADLGVVDTNNINLLNFFGDPQAVTNLSAQDGDPTLENGDRVLISTDDGTGNVREATYLGDATITTASVGLNALVASLTVQVNPIEGEIVQYDNGDLAFISDEPLSDARLGVTAQVSVLGVVSRFEGDLSELDAWVRSIPGIGGLLNGVVDLGQFVLDTAIVTVDVDTNGTLVVCFAAGTRILTKHGEVPVESLAVGDQIFTRDHNLQTIRWIGRRALSARALAANPNLRPIRITAGAFGDGLPSEDLLVSPQHRILIGSRIAERMFASHEVLVAAKQLLALDGVDIAMDVEKVEYYHILLDRHEIIFAHGLGAESLYTGHMAIKAMSMDAQIEIFSLFPDLMRDDAETPSARPLLVGKKARHMVGRHIKNNRPIMSRRTRSDLDAHLKLFGEQVEARG